MTQPTEPQQPLGQSGDEAIAQAERVNRALRGIGVPGPAGQQPKPVQPQPRGQIKISSFLIATGTVMVGALALALGWYDYLPDWVLGR